MKLSSLGVVRFSLFFFSVLGGASAYGQTTFPAGSNTFATATVIPEDTVYSLVTNINAFTEEPDEPVHRPGTSLVHAAKTAWWRWTAPETGYCTVDTLRSIGETNPLKKSMLAVYTGTSVNALTPVAAGTGYSTSGSFPDGGLSKVSFYAVKGTDYRIAVDGLTVADVTATSCNVILQIRLLKLRKTGRQTVFTYGHDGGKLGSASLEMTATGKLSGKLFLGTKTYPYAGSFGQDGYFRTSIPQKGAPGTLPISLEIDGTGTGLINATVNSEDIAVTGFPRRAEFTSLTPASTAGQFTSYMLRLGGDDPGAEGFLTMKVAPLGAVTVTGIAPDGTPISFGSYLTEYSGGRYYILGYRSLLKGKATCVIAAVVHETGALDRLHDGICIYRRAAPTTPGTTFYPAGFTTSFYIEGGTYTKPTAGQRALGFLNPTGTGLMTITNSGGELAGDVMEALTLDIKNKFVFGSLVNKPSLKLNPATGLVTGAITIPPAKKRAIKGVLTLENFVPKLRGYVTGSTRNVAMKVEP
ncbi:hypothetical protein SAMN02745166_02285 [Prosthecobacter debontii]|uniref:Uncharacterized protein n=1 Tax=Prosthecobacter debontii TaxID=48467 RepID=A0A1T4Y1I2_9BACT|nr:hypothetical protein [Prosthecobacter debontii]SKA95135.1 hypothetical protein SAMN02745166_02285 [Prosthecobacter debontii]